MKCPKCQAGTKVIATQSSEGSCHQPPEEFKYLKIIRRRRGCLENVDHKFWTIEMTEALWSEIVERIKL